MAKMKAAPKSKNKFADLDADFRSNIENATDDEIKSKLAEISIAEIENLAAKKSDKDLEEKKWAAKEAGQQYADATKFNRLRANYAYFILEARGKV